jgi:hypothetical protein
MVQSGFFQKHGSDVRKGELPLSLVMDGDWAMKKKARKPLRKPTLQVFVLEPITDPAALAALDRRCKHAEKALAASNSDLRKGPCDMGTWAPRVAGHACKEFSMTPIPLNEGASFPNTLPLILSQCAAEWFRKRPNLRLRFIVPIQKDGDTVELHAWFDAHVFPPPPKPPPWKARAICNNRRVCGTVVTCMAQSRVCSL